MRAYEFINEAEWDPKGWGSTPYGTDIDYFGIRVKMRPSTFLKLAAPLSRSSMNPEVKKHMTGGGKIAFPFLEVKIPSGWEEDDLHDYATVEGHEGRNRVTNWMEIHGDEPIQVNIIGLGGMRRRHFTPEIIERLSQGMHGERGRMFVRGPLFDSSTVLESIESNHTSEAERYKDKLTKSLPWMMKFLSKTSKDYVPSEDEMLDVIEAGYNIMLQYGDVNKAGEVVRNKLKSLISKEGVSEGSYVEGGSITHDGVEYDFDSVMSIAEKMPTKTCSVDKLSWVLEYDTPNKERLERADITIPLIVTKSVNGKLAAIDGLHRLAKAVRDNVKTLPVKYIKPSELESAKLNKQGMAEGLGQDIPSVLYHATYKPRLKSIKLKGLGAGGKRNWEDSQRGVVYLALDPNVAESYAETSDMVPEEWLDQIVILKISTAGLDPNKFGIDSNVQDNSGDTVEYRGVIPVSNISLYKQGVAEDWSEKYKKSINCKNPKGFSQRAHCQGRKKHNESVEIDNTNTPKPHRLDKVKNWIRDVYSKFPVNPMNSRQRVMTWGEGDDMEFVIFELSPKILINDAAEIDWISSYPHGSGVGTKGIKALQDLAADNGISLTLSPWDKGRMSQRKLIQFYKNRGFRMLKSGSKTMIWSPTSNTQQNISEEEIDEAIRSSVYPSNIPPEYRQYPIIGKGFTSLVLDAGPDKVIMLTRDSIKTEWLSKMWGLGIAKIIDVIDSRHQSKRMAEIPIMVLEIPKYYKLSRENKIKLKNALNNYAVIYSSLFSKLPYHVKHNIQNFQKHRTIIEFKALEEYTEKYGNDLFGVLKDFLSNYDPTQYSVDIHMRNFLQDSDGNIVVIDPIVSKNLIEISRLYTPIEY